MFFVQERLGKDEKPFNIYKLKTMRDYSSAQVTELISSHGFKSNGKILHDPRITPVGKYLRKYFIDEIPQVINLVKGDIKLVGVRAATEQYWSLRPWQLKKMALQHKPGLISLQYALDNPTLERIDAYNRLYLREYNKNPLKADIKFGMATLCGILRGNTSE